jgi:hypothetical protein
MAGLVVRINDVQHQFSNLGFRSLGNLLPFNLGYDKRGVYLEFLIAVGSRDMLVESGGIRLLVRAHAFACTDADHCSKIVHMPLVCELASRTIVIDVAEPAVGLLLGLNIMD